MRTNNGVTYGLSICSPISGANRQLDFILIQRSRSNSNQSDSSIDLSSLSVSSNSNQSGEQQIEYICPSDSEDEKQHFLMDNNDEIYLEKHLSKPKLDKYLSLEETNFQRSKRSNKKVHAKRQIKSKHAKTIKYKSHNKHLYIHHRLTKRIHLDPPSTNYKPSDTIPVPLYTSEQLRGLIYRYQRPQHHLSKTRVYDDDDETELLIEQTRIYASHQFRDYTLNEFNIPDEPSYDDAMVTFMLEMQNRDLSPEDYEMLLRLDERIQRKTVNTNILSSLPTIDVDDRHLNDLCSICIDSYHLGQQVKLLPCSHLFHKECIEKYFQEFSNQCPLDNLPLI